MPRLPAGSASSTAAAVSAGFGTLGLLTGSPARRASRGPGGNGLRRIRRRFDSGDWATVQYSVNGGNSFVNAGSAAPSSDRPDFPAIAISPDGTDAYVTYTNFQEPWLSTTSDPRNANVVVRHADVTPVSGAVGSFTDLERDQAGDARGSSANGLAEKFLGDYNYAVATRENGITTANDVRNAVDCPAIDAYRQSLATGSPIAAPAEEQVCPLAFGNSDIFGGLFSDPTP